MWEITHNKCLEFIANIEQIQTLIWDKGVVSDSSSGTEEMKEGAFQGEPRVGAAWSCPGAPRIQGTSLPSNPNHF